MKNKNNKRTNNTRDKNKKILPHPDEIIRLVQFNPRWCVPFFLLNKLSLFYSSDIKQYIYDISCVVQLYLPLILQSCTFLFFVNVLPSDMDLGHYKDKCTWSCWWVKFAFGICWLVRVCVYYLLTNSTSVGCSTNYM